MSYHLVALMARPSNGGFADAVARMGGITCVLPQELVVVPLTPTVKKTASTGDDQAVLGFHELTEGIVRVGESLSLICRTAYVHAENDAGPGFQAAVGWEEGSLCWGPCSPRTAEVRPRTTTRWPSWAKAQSTARCGSWGWTEAIVWTSLLPWASAVTGGRGTGQA